MIRLMIALVVIGGLGVIDARGADAPTPMTADQAVATFERATAQFNEATRLQEDDSARAEELFGESISRFRSLIDAGIESAELHYNIGNAHMRLGEVGHAIASYRRAASLAPSNENILANLAFARSRVRSGAAPPDDGGPLDALLFWHRDLSPAVRWAVFLVGFNAFWILALIRLTNRWRLAPRGALVGVGAVALLMAGSLVWDEAAPRPRSAVIVAEEVIGRKGPDANAYEPSFSAPLTEGVEGRVRERRSGWTLIELGDGRTTWTPDDAIEIV
ncbi:MAG: tetratricopeptide repeat protein [Planctomycetota bacterium]|nr:tetratricopeptide repeat protein [Planctomycetota bacterium]